MNPATSSRCLADGAPIRSTAPRPLPSIFGTASSTRSRTNPLSGPSVPQPQLPGWIACGPGSLHLLPRGLTDRRKQVQCGFLFFFAPANPFAAGNLADPESFCVAHLLSFVPFTAEEHLI